MQINAMKETTKNTFARIPHATNQANICRICSPSRVEQVNDHVIVEEPVTIMVHRVGSFTVMCTPVDIEALTVGFLFSEGMIDGADDVIAIHTKDHVDNVVGVEIQRFSQFEVQRNLIVASSCGMCGVRNIEKLLANIPPCAPSLEVEESLLPAVIERLHSMQHLFRTTGSAHAAAIFEANGTIRAVAEDIGRHSALDKAIGKCLLARQSPRGLGVALSGRVSLEMVAKAARAGIELIVAVSGVSSFAITAARRWHITLCGFVRQGRANIYTYPERVRFSNNGRYRHAGQKSRAELGSQI